MTDELTQGVKDAQAKFDAGMGADGDASPYPMLRSCGRRHRFIPAGLRWGSSRIPKRASRSSRRTRSTR